MNEAIDKLSVDFPGGVKVEANGRDTRMVLLMLLCVTACVGAVVWHDMGNRDSIARIEQSLSDIQRHSSDMVCLLAVPEKDRFNSLCLSDTQRERATGHRGR